MKKILVVFTGGTIASAVDGGYISPKKKNAYKLLEMYKNEKCSVHFENISPYNILSENLNAEYICELVCCVRENINKGYDGIIITHGTDTIQYSAAALSYALGINSIPVVFVSSNYVLEDKRSNGYENFCAAVEFICQNCGRGVFASYKNSDGDVYIHRGSRLLNHKMYTDDLISVKNSFYAKLSGGVFVKNKDYFEIADEAPLLDFSKDDIKKSVLMINVYPNMKFEFKLENVFAVLLCSYHSGTICSDESELESFLDYAKSCGAFVFLLGSGGKILYESANKIDNKNLKLLDFAAAPAMYIKLLFSQGQGSGIFDFTDKSIGADIVKFK